MKVRVNHNIVTDDVFQITINNISKDISATNTSLLYDLNVPGRYSVSILQYEKTRQKPIVEWGLYFVTILIQGLFHILLFDVENKWYEDINPYILSVEFDIYVDTDISIDIKYIRSKYKDNKWFKPSLEISVTPEKEITPTIKVNNHLNNFKEVVRSQIKKIVSVSLVGMTIFGFLLYQALKIYNIVAIILLSAIELLLGILSIVLCVLTYIKAKKMIYNFFSDCPTDNILFEKDAP